MTKVEFHFNVADRVHYACRLLRKASNANNRLVVTGESDILEKLNQDLWTFSATDFVAHGKSEDESAMHQRSPVVLSSSVSLIQNPQVLINLGAIVPSNFDQFSRVIEIVGKDPDLRLAARQRWKYYAGAGIELTQFDLDQKAA